MPIRQVTATSRNFVSAFIAGQLKKPDNGKTPIRLGRDIFTQVFVNLDPPTTVLDTAVHLIPKGRIF